MSCMQTEGCIWLLLKCIVSLERDAVAVCTLPVTNQVVIVTRLGHTCKAVTCTTIPSKEKNRKDYTFRRQFNEKPSIILGCPPTIRTQHINHDEPPEQHTQGESDRLVLLLTCGTTLSNSPLSWTSNGTLQIA